MSQSTDLSDAALRERLFAAFQSEAIQLVRQKAISREDCSALVSSFARIAAAECIALRDAARAEQDTADQLAREALAVVAEQLPTPEEIAQITAQYCNSPSHGSTTLNSYTRCGRCRNETDALLLLSAPTREALAQLLPTLLRDLRGWLSVKDG